MEFLYQICFLVHTCQTRVCVHMCALKIKKSLQGMFLYPDVVWDLEASVKPAGVSLQFLIKTVLIKTNDVSTDYVYPCGG